MDEQPEEEISDRKRDYGEKAAHTGLPDVTLLLR
jgi:hypothetical protein